MMNGLTRFAGTGTDFWNGFDGIFSDTLKPLASLVPAAAELTPMNVRKVEGAVEYELAVPGFSKDQIKVSVEDGRVAIQASKQTESGQYSRREWVQNEIRRQWLLPKHAVVEQIEASAENGILTIKVPTQAEKQQAIEVQIK